MSQQIPNDLPAIQVGQVWQCRSQRRYVMVTDIVRSLVCGDLREWSPGSTHGRSIRTDLIWRQTPKLVKYQGIQTPMWSYILDQFPADDPCSLLLLLHDA